MRRGGEGRSGADDGVVGGMTAKLTEGAGFGGLHTVPVVGLEVVVAAEVEDTVHDASEEFIGPWAFEAVGLEHDFAEADEDLAVQLQAGRFGLVVEGDDIGGSRVPQVGFVQAGDETPSDDVNAQGVTGEAEVLVEVVVQQGAPNRDRECGPAGTTAEDQLAGGRCWFGLGLRFWTVCGVPRRRG